MSDFGRTVGSLRICGYYGEITRGESEPLLEQSTTNSLESKGNETLLPNLYKG